MGVDVVRRKEKSVVDGVEILSKSALVLFTYEFGH